MNIRYARRGVLIEWRQARSPGRERGDGKLNVIRQLKEATTGMVARHFMMYPQSSLKQHVPNCRPRFHLHLHSVQTTRTDYLTTPTNWSWLILSIVSDPYHLTSNHSMLSYVRDYVFFSFFPNPSLRASTRTPEFTIDGQSSATKRRRSQWQARNPAPGTELNASSLVQLSNHTEPKRSTPKKHHTSTKEAI